MKQEEAEQQDNVEQSEEESRCVPLAESLSYGAGTFLAAGVVDLAAHFGPTGLVVGGIVAYVASQHGPELVEQVRGAFPARPSPSPSHKQGHAPHTLASESGGSKRSFLDRALGRFPTHEDAPLEDADTTLFDEPELDIAPYRFMQQRSARSIMHPIRLAPDLYS